MRISFIVPVKNDENRLRVCLASIAADDELGLTETVVADNGSTDLSWDVAVEAGARVLCLPNRCVAALRNQAARASDGTLLAFVDADQEIGKGWLEAAAKVFSDPSVGAAGALCAPPSGGTWVQQMYGALRGRTVGYSEASWLGAGNMVVRRQAFEHVGGFDTTLTTCEDVDLCRRLRTAGWKLISDERFFSVHHGDPKTLGDLFKAELWRGRDNLRVSLRRPLAIQDLPSIVMPILTVLTVVLFLAGAIGLRPHLAVVPASLLAGLVLFRALRMKRNMGSAAQGSFRRILSVAATYDMARALALVTRAPHHRR